jgi:hypothetical protein
VTSPVRRHLQVASIRVDAAYRALMDHCQDCLRCQAGTTCRASQRLRRAWYAARGERP